MINLLELKANDDRPSDGKIMKRTIKEIFSQYTQMSDEALVVEGWIKQSRSSNSFGFFEINDGTYFKNLQLVLDKNILKDDFDNYVKFTTYTGIRAIGILVLTPESKQPFEVQVQSIELLAESERDYPLQNKRHTMEYLRDIAHLRPRSNTFQATFRVRSELSFAIHNFFHERGFVYVHTPLISASDAEGAGEMFRVTTLDAKTPPLDEQGKVDFSKDFFGKESYLTVSGQLQAEAFALAYKNVYTFGPTFRAENSNTVRHAAEFWMIEPEIAFSDINDDMVLAEDLLKYIIGYALNNCPLEMEFFNSFIDKELLGRLEHIVTSQFEQITYTKAIDILQKSNHTFDVAPVWGIDLQTEHERYLTEQYLKKPVFVTDYPKDIKAFYMRLNDDEQTVAAVDCLVPAVGEIIGGSQREERIDLLNKRIDDMHMNRESLDWYLQLRKYGGVKHAGFGLGFERAIMYITGMKNIRDVIPFPRTAKNCKF
jgi:asparaginyl-tRNA synthetase